MLWLWYAGFMLCLCRIICRGVSRTQFLHCLKVKRNLSYFRAIFCFWTFFAVHWLPYYSNAYSTICNICIQGIDGSFFLDFQCPLGGDPPDVPGVASTVILNGDGTCLIQTQENDEREMSATTQHNTTKELNPLSMKLGVVETHV